MAIAPSELAAKMVARNSVLLYESRPTTSPGPTPRSCSPVASLAAHSAIPWYVTVRSSNTASGLSGVRRAWCSSTRSQLMSADDAVVMVAVVVVVSGPDKAVTPHFSADWSEQDYAPPVATRQANERS